MALGKLLFILRHVNYGSTKKGEYKPQSQDHLVDELVGRGIHISKSTISKYERDEQPNQQSVWGEAKSTEQILKKLFYDIYDSKYHNVESSFVRALNNAVNIGATPSAKNGQIIFSQTTKNFLLGIINHNSVDNIIERLIYHAKDKDFSIYKTDEEYIASLNHQIEETQTKKIELLPGNAYTLPEFTYLDFIGRNKEITDLK